MNNYGTLFLIPNTLGLPDQEPASILPAIIPDLVLRQTAELAYFVAENAKTTRAHLKLVGQIHALKRPLQEIQISELNINTPASALEALLQPLLDGHDVGLISEAGVPAVADPGANLVRLAHQRAVPVSAMVGPSSILLSVMSSGLNGQSFAFNGYLPTDAAARSKRIRELEERSRKEQQTQLFIETPYRNAALLEALCHSCQAATQICVATDLSLPKAQVQTRSAAEWKQLLATGKLPDFHKRPTVFLFLA